MSALEARLVVSRPTGFTLSVELTIPTGTTVALLGPNGAGKSTAVDAIAGIEPIDQGRIELGSRVLDDPERRIFVPAERRRIGVVFQRYYLFDHLSVVDNIGFGLVAAGRSRRRARAEAGRWAELLDIADLLDRRPGELSGGQAQRVALARALAIEPDAVLLDEPLAALDVATRTQLRRTLRTHLATVAGPRLLITHDPTDAVLLADRIAIVEAGRITQTGTPEEIRRRPATPYVAALAGVNLFAGRIDRGTVDLDGHPIDLAVADSATTGSVLLTIQPASVALHRQRPDGSPRNVWSTAIVDVEPLGDVTRITVGAPLPLSVDVTPAATEAMGLRPGEEIWASVKATEITVTQA